MARRLASAAYRALVATLRALFPPAPRRPGPDLYRPQTTPADGMGLALLAAGVDLETLQDDLWLDHGRALLPIRVPRELTDSEKLAATLWSRQLLREQPSFFANFFDAERRVRPMPAPFPEGGRS